MGQFHLFKMSKITKLMLLCISPTAISYITGKPTNSIIRPAALLEPNQIKWAKYFIMNSSQENIKYHSEGMRQIGAQITLLMEELFEHSGILAGLHI